MTSGLRWQFWSTVALILFCGWYTAANWATPEQRHASWWLPNQGIRLGLDLQGGIQWVLGVKLEAAVDHELEHLRGRLQTTFEEEKLTPKRLAVVEDDLVVETQSPEDLARVEKLTSDWNVLERVRADDSSIAWRLNKSWAKDVREKGMQQVLEVLRRRIEDPLKGIQDSVVTRQGDDRILVQIPGGQVDRAQARSLIAVTGFLEFKMVQDAASTEDLLKAKHGGAIPEDMEVVYEKDRQTNAVTHVFLVRKAADLTGDYLEDARVTYDRQQRPVVSFTFNSDGAQTFATLTEKNVGKALAIVLDKQVYSAPVIRERIGGQGQIEGRFNTQQATDLAVVLRSGSLSIPVAVEQERTIGPALGADSIHRGLLASLLAVALVITFASVYYRLSGVYASVALLTNLVMLIGIMSLFRATLTMPGIAGLVLTVGMAIDANVIIFERIREELRGGKTPRAAIAAGFNKAWWTVFDANLTTLISAFVLFEFGTGPVKGFAVTLCIGILTSVFTAMVVTRLLYAVYPGERRVAELSI